MPGNNAEKDQQRKAWNVSWHKSSLFTLSSVYSTNTNAAEQTTETNNSN